MEKDYTSADMIKSILETAGLGRRDICSLYGIPYRTLQDWELGRRNPPEWFPLILRDALAQKFPDKFSKTS